jgi:biopolymer transport protein ExbB
VRYDLTALEDLAATHSAEAHALRASPLYHLYHVGAEEIKLHLAGYDERLSKILSPQSITVVRCALDRRLVREIQNLNKSMVLLTIAIAGGPFLGLLGTVVGVMITFASIAAAGDVNVNAIAPGISAALAATVAGLIVAIPALFGYNYLTVRIRNIVADLRVFVDEIVARMAQRYSLASVEPDQVAE